ncbi:PREDICTED: chymotrypsin-2-like [Trachymyrmex septentrionalis]|uniref:chymotrypsin-2-like n=1 Tax=Trachymyrmex septentrionalis TaxID=34720 RepID=UPI00084EF491|nr:PREDICTED: chymotrypsin-2-like [Trachymyrmex septentrionalis]
MKQLMLAILQLIALAVVDSYGNETARLVHGNSTSIKKNPHCASIKVLGKYMCGGTIISKQHILTAAHCVYDLYNDKNLLESTTVVTGTTYLNKGGETHKVEKVYFHERYNPHILAVNDIGLVKLLKTIKFGPTQQRIMLPKSDIAINENVMIAAWGRTGFQKPLHNNLQKLDMKVMLPTTCQARYDKSSLTMRIHKNDFCTYIKNGIGLCNGDSGSGVIRKHDRKIVGLVSGGIPCARGYPDIYTNVYRYVNWIKVALLIRSVYTSCRMALNLGSLVIHNHLPLQTIMKREKEKLSFFTDIRMDVSKYSAYIDYEWAIGLNRTSLALLGVWPKNNETKQKKLISNICTILMLNTAICGCYIPSIHSLFKVWGDIMSMIDNLQYTLPLSVSIIKLSIMWLKKKGNT